MYDQREKAQRDYKWAITGAREEGREEVKLAGKIQLLQQLLEETPTSDTELLRQDIGALTTQLAGLQKRLRDRDVYPAFTYDARPCTYDCPVPILLQRSDWIPR